VEPKDGSGSPSSSPEAELASTVDEKKLLRKIDLRVLPMLFMVYVVAFLDRSSF
jgi:hypothetical protein